MVVRTARGRMAEGTQAAGHPEVDEQGVGGEAEQQVFAAPMDGVDGAPGDPRGQPAGTDQRNRRSYTCMTTTRRSTTSGAIPRSVVSTSGNSGIGAERGVRMDRRPPETAAPVWWAVEYTLR